jgi:hypothetical protein
MSLVSFVPTLIFCDTSVTNKAINNGSIDEDELLTGMQDVQNMPRLCKAVTRDMIGCHLNLGKLQPK